MDADLVITDTLIIPASELMITAARSSGPGGQHVNKTSSKILLRWSPQTSNVLSDEQRALILERLQSRLVGGHELLIQVESERSQHRNRTIALERLRELLRYALRPVKARKPTRIPARAHARRLDEKKKRGLIKKIRRAGLDY